MTIIKTILITAFTISSTAVFAQEQQMKTELAKPVSATVPPPGSKPVLAPEIKPAQSDMPQLKSSEQPAATTPSAVKEEQVKGPQETPTLKTVDKVSNTESLSSENMKTLNGTAQRPKQAAPLANDQQVKPLQVAAPAVVPVKEN